MSRIVHQLATCMECDWVNSSQQWAKKEAKAHSIKTGHRVIGETGTAWSYGKKKKQLES